MINTLFIGILTFLSSGLISELDLPSLREMSEKANRSEEEGAFFADYMQEYKNSAHPLLKAYAAASEVYLAQYGWNPYAKFDHFSKGTNVLDKVAADYPENVEIRYIRFAIQHEAPFFLGYRNALDVDRKIILDSFASMSDRDLKKRIASFMTAKVDLTAEEIKVYSPLGKKETRKTVLR